MHTLAYLRGCRKWLVRDITVQGLDSDAEFHYLISEKVDSTDRLE